jgi:hypothetical protein
MLWHELWLSHGVNDLTTLALFECRIRFRADAWRMSAAACDKLRASGFLMRVRLSSVHPAERSHRYGDAVFSCPPSGDRRSIAVMEKRTATPIRDRHLGICASAQTADKRCQIRLLRLPRVAPVPSANGAPRISPDLPATWSHDPWHPSRHEQLSGGSQNRHLLPREIPPEPSFEVTLSPSGLEILFSLRGIATV